MFVTEIRDSNDLLAAIGGENSDLFSSFDIYIIICIYVYV